MRILALSHDPSTARGTRAASYPLHRWLTRLGHAVSWVFVASMPVFNLSPRIPQVSLSSPYATRQLVRLAKRSGSDAIVGVGEPKIDAIAREACEVLGISFIAGVEELV